LLAGEEVTWFNPQIAPLAEALNDIAVTAADVRQASDRLQRFAPFLAEAFPQVAASAGIIESELVGVPNFARALCARYNVEGPVRLLLKKDSHLPISGSVKARGGIYEVLFHAEQLAIRHGLLSEADDYRRLADEPCQALFRKHQIAVGSTGNLGIPCALHLRRAH
jgi:D-serine dehydratase